MTCESLTDALTTAPGTFCLISLACWSIWWPIIGAGGAADGGADDRAPRRGAGGVADHGADGRAGAGADDGALLLLVERCTRARGHEDRERGR